jgi:hypothetical protein
MIAVTGERNKRVERDRAGEHAPVLRGAARSWFAQTRRIWHENFLYRLWGVGLERVLGVNGS